MRKRLEHHGKTNTPEYSAWRAMIARCHRPTHPSYTDYGARGIVVCERWRTSFASFFADMGARPSEDHEIDRVDNDRGYEPSNCRWTTRETQMRNTRRTRMVTIDGRTQCVADWCKEHGVPPSLAATRESALGWPIERAITTPPKTQLTNEERGLIRAEFASGQTPNIIASRHGVSRRTVSRVVRAA